LIQINTARLMRANHIGDVVVVDCDGRLKGLISVDDLVPLLARELAEIGALIRYEQAAETRKTGEPLKDEHIGES
jgi:hypothetical protein